MLTVVTPTFGSACAWRARSILENLRAHFHDPVFGCRQNADRRIAVALQQAEKLALRSQTKQRLAIVHRLDNRSYAFIISTNLKRDDPLPACGKKNFARKNFNKELPALEVDLGSRRREAKPLKAGAREHNCIPIARREFAQACRHIAAKLDNGQARVFPGKLMFPSHAARCNRRAFPKRS